MSSVDQGVPREETGEGWYSCLPSARIITVRVLLRSSHKNQIFKSNEWFKVVRINITPSARLILMKKPLLNLAAKLCTGYSYHKRRMQMRGLNSQLLHLHKNGNFITTKSSFILFHVSLKESVTNWWTQMNHHSHPTGHRNDKCRQDKKGYRCNQSRVVQCF